MSDPKPIMVTVVIGGQQLIVPIITCDWCGTACVRRRKNQRYCSYDCKVRWGNKMR